MKAFTTRETGISAFMLFVSRKAVYVLTILLVLGASIFRISDLDFWWHLKTGQIIVQQKEFQHEEIYSHTTPGAEYVDHEWLFQVLMYLAYAAAGTVGVIFLKCAVLAIFYLLAARFLLERGASHALTIAIITLSIIGAMQRFIERPEIFSTLFLALIFLSLEAYLRTGNWKSLAPVPAIILIWSNLHAAVILGLVLIGIFLVGVLLENVFHSLGYPPYFGVDRKKILALASLLLLSFLVTGLNPYGFRMLKVPFELTAIIDSGLLNNREWQRPAPYTLPFFYAALFVTFGMNVVSFRRLSFVHFGTAAFLGYIALRYFRNTGMFAMMIPLLVSPYAPTIARHATVVRTSCAVLIALALWTLWFAFPFERGLGPASYFPEKIARFTVQNHLQGNMLNSYGFGGYLIWKLYPERRIFIDGRNEVFLPLLKELFTNRQDSRGWNRMLRKYAIEYALLGYVDQLEEVSIVNSNNQLSRKYLPFTSTRFPRTSWALIYWDDVGMILVRRKGINESLLNLEYTSIFPEGTDYQVEAMREEALDRNTVILELKRKLKEEPDCKRAQRIMEQIKRGNP